MKRFVAAALLIVSAICLAAFAGCNEEQAHEHEWNEGVVSRAATYTHEGETTYTCKTCGGTRTEAIDKLAYTADKTVNAGESISSAVASAEEGDFIAVKAGTYHEQLVVDGKNVTIIGEGAVVIAGPEDYAALRIVEKPGTDEKNYAALVLVQNSTAVLENISVTGNPDKANIAHLTSDNSYCGVAAIDSELRLDYVNVKDVTYPERPSGIQNGTGVFAAAKEENKKLTVRYSEISSFNKTGLIVREGVSELIFEGNTVTGAGAQARNCQNGIQIACPKASITGNTVKNLVYEKDDEWVHASWALLVYSEGEKSVQVSANTFSNVDNGVYIIVNGSTQLGENKYENLYEDGYSNYETPAEGEEQQ